MCGRFVLASDPDHWMAVLDVDELLADPLPPSWNVAPTDPVYAVVAHAGRRRMGTMAWGLVPPWADDARSRHINARAETVATTPAFRDSFARRRCLVPSDGFYEWQSTGLGRIPHHITRSDGPMVFAGVWSARTDPITRERHPTVAILTIDAREDLAAIHDRMPVWLGADLWEEWLDPATSDPDLLAPVIAQSSPGSVTARPVGDDVGNVRTNRPDLLDDRKDLFS